MYRLPPKKAVATREVLEDLLEPWPKQVQNITDIDEMRIREAAHPGLLNQLEEVIDGTDICTPKQDGLSAWEQAIETLALRSLPQSTFEQPGQSLNVSALDRFNEPGPEWEILPSQLNAFERMTAMKTRLEVEFDRTDPTALFRTSPQCRPLRDVKGADEFIFSKTITAETQAELEDIRCKDKRKLVYPPLSNQLSIPKQWRSPPKLLPLAKKAPEIKNELRDKEEEN